MTLKLTNVYLCKEPNDTEREPDCPSRQLRGWSNYLRAAGWREAG